MLLLPPLVAVICLSIRLVTAVTVPITSPDRVVVEALSDVPANWVLLETAPPPSSRLYLRIALPKADQTLFEQTALQIATPGHARYGQHLQRDEVTALMRPGAAATSAVRAWLAAAQIPSSDIDEQGDLISFWTFVTGAEALLDTTFHLYENTDSGERIVRALDYSVPAAIAKHLVMIQPTTRFGQIKATSIARASSSHTLATRGKLEGGGGSSSDGTAFNYTASCGSGSITPTCLRALYNIGNHTANATSGARMGVTGFLNQSAKYHDLDRFLHKYAPYAVGANFTGVSINNGTLNQDEFPVDASEANLDVQYAIALAYPVETTFYATGGLGFLVPDQTYPSQIFNNNEPYLDFLTYLLAQPDDALPQTLTTSYGEDEQSVPEAYARTVCDMFGALGARGVSVIFGSGDSGVGSNCERNDGSNATHFNPMFPASCPWVTSVGATSGYHERATLYSSGGFSDYWPRPPWQHAAVEAYLDVLGDQWNGLFNKNGRGFPDVSAQGTNFQIYNFGIQWDIFGTSCSAPTFAGLISLINDDRLSKSQPPLGFLNPFIYSLSNVTSFDPPPFNDIILGGSSGCNGRDPTSNLPTKFVPYASWNATVGWDPVTGMGTPDFGGLLAASRSLN